LRRPRVLLADDHLPVIDRLTSILRFEFDVIGAVSDGRSLVGEAERLHPDVIVLDITMPELTGIEAAHELKEAGSTAKLVFLTVHQQAAFVHECFAEGGLGYVTKARLLLDLIPAINEALSGRHFVSPSVSR